MRSPACCGAPRAPPGSWRWPIYHPRALRSLARASSTSGTSGRPLGARALADTRGLAGAVCGRPGPMAVAGSAATRWPALHAVCTDDVLALANSSAAAPPPPCGLEPLHLAAALGRSRCLRVLLDAGGWQWGVVPRLAVQPAPRAAHSALSGPPRRRRQPAHLYGSRGPGGPRTSLATRRITADTRCKAHTQQRRRGGGSEEARLLAATRRRWRLRLGTERNARSCASLCPASTHAAPAAPQGVCKSEVYLVLRELLPNQAEFP